MTPAQRGAYLRWLAEGRGSPNLEGGYLYLFIQGLERWRLLDEDREQAAAILNEVERLSEPHADATAFKRHCDLFTNTIRLRMPTGPWELRPNKRRLRHHFHPINPTLPAVLTTELDGYPDPTHPSAPLRDLRALHIA